MVPIPTKGYNKCRSTDMDKNQKLRMPDNRKRVVCDKLVAMSP